MKKIRELMMININIDEGELDDNLDTYLYVQVNNKLVRKIKLVDLLNNKKDKTNNYKNEQNDKILSDSNSNEYNDENDEDININNTKEVEINMNENIQKSSDNDDLIERIDIKNILEEELINQQDSLPNINIRFFIKTQLMSLVNSSSIIIDHINAYFSKLNENVALHVKFGDFLPSNSLKQRTKRHSIKKSSKVKNYRDCSELRRHGYTSNNYTCCRETISFSIEQIGWSHWILSPKIIEYKYCRGGCYGLYFAIINFSN